MTSIKPPPPPDPDATGAPVLPTDPIVVAAQKMVVAMFDAAAAQMPALIKAHAPPANPIPQFTDDMIDQLKARLRSAFRLPPDEPEPPA